MTKYFQMKVVYYNVFSDYSIQISISYDNVQLPHDIYDMK